MIYLNSLRSIQTISKTLLARSTMLRMYQYLLTLFFLLIPGLQSFASDKYLITMPGPKAGIAKTFKSGGEGVYHFTLDLTKKVKQGNKKVPVTFEIVKKAVEKKLRRFKAKVKGSGANVTVSWNAKKLNEKKFLKKISKTWIKSGSASAVQVAGTTSDGGVRARTTARDPAGNEVQARIIKVRDGTLEFKVVKKGPKAVAIPLNKMLKTRPKGFTAKTGQMFYFKPAKETGGLWEGTGFSAK